MMEIFYAAGLIGAVGIAIGLLLGFAGKKFAVETDPKEDAVLEALPGNNCGGCGYAGCADLAAAIAAGKAPVNACPVGGAAVAEKVGEIMGVAAQTGPKKYAFVRCTGSCESAKRDYEYNGVYDCDQAASVPGGGGKACRYGCAGLGNCVRACEFGALKIVNGVAHVDKEKCVACGACVKACPKGLITILTQEPVYTVACASHDGVKRVMQVCRTGCRACGLCAKLCPVDAITMDNGLAVIDREKCAGCGLCERKCPAGCIRACDEEI
ncbi:MAG: RnfABCDGE type electron transport complex subunit B [Lachnospiraceae bacterium]|nr:RnfABCDGE type electron transport complex subunit B [Lachnospiraceae bacterium]